jgi:hypothetical protein
MTVHQLRNPQLSEVAARFKLNAERDTMSVLLNNLARELFQTETSAALHCRREAKRLGAAPPAQPMIAVADHADAVLVQLPQLVERSHIHASFAGLLVGALFSEVREYLLDHFVEAERSYRGTLLGMRHGVDLVYLLLRAVEQQQDHSELAFFCRSWLDVRAPLLTRAQEQLAWFAEHSERAIKTAKRPASGPGVWNWVAQRMV